MASPTELAREAMEHSRAIRKEFDFLKQLVELRDLPGLQDRLMSVQLRIDAIEMTAAILRAEYDSTSRKFDNFDLVDSRERTAVLETRVEELERCKQEADKRQWQFVYIFAGGMATLLVTAVVQLLISVIKK
jgi:hypothetical protein